LLDGAAWHVLSQVFVVLHACYRHYCRILWVLGCRRVGERESLVELDRERKEAVVRRVVVKAGLGLRRGCHG